MSWDMQFSLPVGFLIAALPVVIVQTWWLGRTLGKGLDGVGNALDRLETSLDSLDQSLTKVEDATRQKHRERHLRLVPGRGGSRAGGER